MDNEISHNDFQLVSQHLVMAEHLNPNHAIFGGQLLGWLDVDVYLFCTNKLRYKHMVTVSMNNVFFKNPAYLGDIIQIHARLKETKRSSVTAFGRAVAFDPEKQTTRDIIECEITYVALDENNKPARIFAADAHGDSKAG